MNIVITEAVAEVKAVAATITVTLSPLQAAYAAAALGAVVSNGSEVGNTFGLFCALKDFGLEFEENYTVVSTVTNSYTPVKVIRN